MEKLKIVPVKYGIGKYYTYTDGNGKKHPVIEMPVDMLDYDQELFCWILEHELEHYLFYQKEENQGKKNKIMPEILRLLENPMMAAKLNIYEKNHPRAHEKRFKLVDDKYRR